MIAILSPSFSSYIEKQTKIIFLEIEGISRYLSEWDCTTSSLIINSEKFFLFHNLSKEHFFRLFFYKGGRNTRKRRAKAYIYVYVIFFLNLHQHLITLVILILFCLRQNLVLWTTLILCMYIYIYVSTTNLSEL